MESQPTSETVTLIQDLIEINRRDGSGLCGYAIFAKDEDGDAIRATAWSTYNTDFGRVPNPVFERLQAMQERLKAGAQVSGFTYRVHYDGERDQKVQVFVSGVGQAVPKEHVEDEK
jgi:hypothetical protein